MFHCISHVDACVSFAEFGEGNAAVGDDRGEDNLKEVLGAGAASHGTGNRHGAGPGSVSAGIGAGKAAPGAKPDGEVVRGTEGGTERDTERGKAMELARGTQKRTSGVGRTTKRRAGRVKGEEAGKVMPVFAEATAAEDVEDYRNSEAGGKAEGEQ